MENNKSSINEWGLSRVLYVQDNSTGIIRNTGTTIYMAFVEGASILLL